VAAEHLGGITFGWHFFGDHPAWWDVGMAERGSLSPIAVVPTTAARCTALWVISPGAYSAPGAVPPAVFAARALLACNAACRCAGYAYQLICLPRYARTLTMPAMLTASRHSAFMAGRASHSFSSFSRCLQLPPLTLSDDGRHSPISS